MLSAGLARILTTGRKIGLQGEDRGTDYEALNLLDTLTGTDGDGNLITVEGVTWECSPSFDGMVSKLFPGYEFMSVLPEGLP